MDCVQVAVPATERVTVLARVAAGHQTVRPVLLEVLDLRQYDHLAGVGVNDADDLFAGVSAVLVDHRAQQVPGSGDEKEPRRSQVLVDGGLPNVPKTGLDLNRYNILVDDLTASLSFVGSFSAVGQYHNHVVLEVVTVIVGTRIVRLLHFVIGTGIEHITLLPPREEKDGYKVCEERAEGELFEDSFLFVHNVMLVG